MNIKLQASFGKDIENIISQVDSFDEGVTMLDDISFHSALDNVEDGEVLGVIATPQLLEWLKEEYNITFKEQEVKSVSTDGLSLIDSLGHKVTFYSTKEKALCEAYNSHHPEHGIVYPYSAVLKNEDDTLLYAFKFFSENETKSYIWSRVIDSKVFDDESPSTHNDYN